MSTDHQRYSTENQADVIGRYAASRNMVIVRTYADEGKSGLNIEGRDALKRLIADVENGDAGFEVILVYDVSRWGRFQDQDESAYYEYRCRRAGMQIHFCAEPFENDGTPFAALAKSFKRSMAGEYSRELSTKVFIGQCRLIERGYRQGGAAGYGLRRLLINESGQPKATLERGQQKSLQTDRVILVPGPTDEVKTVRRIYRLFVHEARAETEIAAILNREGIPTDLNREWTRGTVHQVLTNEKYVGNNVFNRTSFKLKKRRVRNPAEMWVRADGVFEALVDPAQFVEAARIIAERSQSLSNDELLQKLSVLFQSVGMISGIIIDEHEGLPSSSVYRSRFGSLLRAYTLVGYRPRRDYRYIEINRVLRQHHCEVVEDVYAGIRASGGWIADERESGLLRVNDEFSLSLILARCQRTPTGSYRWRLRFEAGLRPDITLAVRMDATNERALDYYILPSIDPTASKLRLAAENGVFIDAYRFDSISPLFELAARAAIPEAA